MRLTGRLRIREHRRLFRPSIYVLQAEIEQPARKYPSIAWGYQPRATELVWRDWRPEDATLEKQALST